MPTYGGGCKTYIRNSSSSRNSRKGKSLLVSIIRHCCVNSNYCCIALQQQTQIQDTRFRCQQEQQHYILVRHKKRTEETTYIYLHNTAARYRTKSRDQASCNINALVCMSLLCSLVCTAESYKKEKTDYVRKTKRHVWSKKSASIHEPTSTAVGT